ncbi:MAG TPA: MerR family transcriptional regulator [Candidatus Dormibacteraeota bacterium]|nr:MerR family transcriptional regulator [Candidatus Dormibacteraeota bacterium]
MKVDVVDVQHPLRMGDLVRQTGVSAATIQFYGASGLLPPTSKRGRTSVRYGVDAVARIRWVRAVQQELRLSLRSIRSVLENLGEIPVAELRTRLALGNALDSAYDVGAAAGDVGVTAEQEAEIAAHLERLGLIESVPPGAPRRAADRRLIELEAAMQAAGFTEANGFTWDQLLLYRDAMRAVVREETRRFVAAGRRLGPQRAGAIVERGLPVIDELLRFFHAQAVLEGVDGWRRIIADGDG